MFGIKEFAAVINPPQGAILAVGAGEQRPVVNDGELAVATVMSCTLSSDHRVVDGAVGAEFMQAFKLLIEDPLKMLL
jgi:pyruvate dehydrogenase E2 component (dihydrolipoamide acetyltransferase)